MKRFLIVLLLAITVNSTFAQQALKSPEAVESAIKSQKEDCNDAKKGVKAKTWIKLAESYLDVIELRLQPENVQAMYKVAESSLTSMDDAAAELDKTLAKALEVDKNDPKKPGKYAKDIAKLYYQPNNGTSLKQALLVSGSLAYEAKDYNKAMLSFGRAAEISDLPIVNSTDTAAYFNAGVAANLAENYDQAVVYYKKAIELNYEGAKTVAYLTKAMAHTKDSGSVADVLQKGIEQFPTENQPLIDELIDYYLKADKTTEALSFLDVAIGKNPSNHIYYYVKGTLFDKQGKIEEARVEYEKSFELKPDFSAAMFNIGVLYYNKGRDILLEANNVPPTGAGNQKKYDDLVKGGLAEFEKSLPFFEKAYAIAPTDMGTIQALKEVYYKLKKTEKYEEMKAKLEAGE